MKSPFYCRLMLARTTIADRFIASLQAGSYGLLHTLGKGIGNPTLRGDEMTAYMDHKNLANEVIDAARAQEITDGVHRVLDRVATAEAQAGREVGSVKLLAATKTRDVGEIMTAIDAGVRMIGENRPQEVTAKAEGLLKQCAQRGFTLGAATAEAVAGGAVAGDADGTYIPFHLIGQLQSNKIGKVSGEASKSGCDPAHAIRIAQKIGTLDGLELQGLMTIGAHVDDETTIRKCFAHLRKTRDLILASKTPGTERCLELSMGMTGDMELAIAEGSTIVRVGTAIFGERAFI